MLGTFQNAVVSGLLNLSFCVDKIITVHFSHLYSDIQFIKIEKSKLKQRKILGYSPVRINTILKNNSAYHSVDNSHEIESRSGRSWASGRSILSG